MAWEVAMALIIGFCAGAIFAGCLIAGRNILRS
jgi:hypothetical protein